MTDACLPLPDHFYESTRKHCCQLPSLARTRDFVDSLTDFLFPVRREERPDKEFCAHRWDVLQRSFRILLQPLEKQLPRPVCQISDDFFAAIPGIHASLMETAEVFSRSDPASQCTAEVLLAYPGFYAITIYRLSHFLFRLGVPILPRVMSEYAHSQTGIDIHPGATIGKDFYIDHGTGVVIGETTVIGDNVKIYQGVTLGALYVGKHLAQTKRHPTIEDNVIVYSGSTILGGDTVVGHDTVIGGNVWLTESVPPYSSVYHRPETVIRPHNG
jgi:serine O-acetyltransferase